MTLENKSRSRSLREDGSEENLLYFEIFIVRLSQHLLGGNTIV